MLIHFGSQWLVESHTVPLTYAIAVDLQKSRGLGDVYKRQLLLSSFKYVRAGTNAHITPLHKKLLFF